MPYLVFDGNCREAMNFYEEVFGGNLEIMTFAEAPDEVFDGGEDKEAIKDSIMHSCLTNGALCLMASDNSKGKPKTGDNVQLSIQCESVDVLDNLFDTLSSGGKSVMPPDNAFWGARFGMLTDKFGINWMLNCPLENKEQ